MGFILFVGANLVAFLLFPIAMVFGVIQAFWKRHARSGMQNADAKFYALAVSLDIYGNVWCRELFNATLITRDAPVKFGNNKQTISAVVGYNLKAGTLTKTGHRLNHFLDLVFGEGHALDAIGEAP
jgi:hypothetical protein